ncbi:MAG: UvrB/UvrC motif-containing protein, partial [Acidobacteriota bacterium]
NGITPQTILKPVDTALLRMANLDYYDGPVVSEEVAAYKTDAEIESEIQVLRNRMRKAAEDFAFERAAQLRDQIKKLQELKLTVGGHDHAD